LVTAGRHPYLVGDAAQHAVAALDEAASRSSFDVLSYVLMPDHAHLLVLGLTETSNAVRLVQRFKEITGFRSKQRYARPMWQRSFYDHVVRRNEDLVTIARYIVQNPIRAGLVQAEDEWPYLGGSLLAGAEAPPLRPHRASFAS
jgi:putative transposase